MTAILLGMARLDAFDVEQEPPDGEPPQVEQGVGGSEGTPEAADVGRQAAFRVVD